MCIQVCSGSFSRNVFKISSEFGMPNSTINFVSVFVFVSRLRMSRELIWKTS